MTLRVDRQQWVPFASQLLGRRDVETAGIILAERLQGDVLLARHLLPVPEEGYEIRRPDRLRISPITLNRMVRRARDEGLCVLTVHTHPGTDLPWFSAADDAGDSRLMPSLFAQMPGPHGSLVIAGETGMTAGRVWTDPATERDLRLRVVGRRLEIHPSSVSSRDDASWFDRQRLALGEAGQRVLRDLHVAVVGLGGTGSVSFVQLAHLGVTRITVIDGDVVEDTNVSRVLGATRGDVGRTMKVDVAARYAERLGLGTSVRARRGHLGREIPVHEVEGCDVVLSCVDRHTPRALLNRLAYRVALPTIDMGSAFRVDQGGRVVAGAGRVVVIGPERRCLACWGHIDPDRLRIEALSAEERAQQAAEGYVAGADIAQPSVVAFNTMIAGAAVIELLRLVTGFAGADDPRIA